MSSYDFLESKTWIGESASALKSARRARGLTLAQMGQDTGIERARYSFIEYPPKPRSPSPDEREAIRRALEDAPAAHTGRGARRYFKPGPAPAPRQRHDRSPSTRIDGNRTLYAYLEKDLRESDVSLYQAIVVRLIVSLGIWLSPQIYRRLPVLIPFAVRDPKARGDKAKGVPDQWGSPNESCLFRDDNSLIKALARSLGICSHGSPIYDGQRIGSGFVACHVWRRYCQISGL